MADNPPPPEHYGGGYGQPPHEETVHVGEQPPGTVIDTPAEVVYRKTHSYLVSTGQPTNLTGTPNVTTSGGTDLSGFNVRQQQEAQKIYEEKQRVLETLNKQLYSQMSQEEITRQNRINNLDVLRNRPYSQEARNVWGVVKPYSMSESLQAEIRRKQNLYPTTQTKNYEMKIKDDLSKYQIPKDIQEGIRYQQQQNAQLTRSAKPLEKFTILKSQPTGIFKVGKEAGKAAYNLLATPVRGILAPAQIGYRLGKEGYEWKAVPPAVFGNPDVQATIGLVGLGGLSGQAGRAAYALTTGASAVNTFWNPSVESFAETGTLLVLPRVTRESQSIWKGISRGTKNLLFSESNAVKNPLDFYRPEYIIKPIRLESGRQIGTEVILKPGQQRFSPIFSPPQVKTLKNEFGIPLEIGRGRFSVKAEKQMGLQEQLPRKSVDFFANNNIAIVRKTTNPFIQRQLPSPGKLSISPSKQVNLVKFGFSSPIPKRVIQSKAFGRMSKPFAYPKVKEKAIESGRGVVKILTVEKEVKLEETIIAKPKVRKMTTTVFPRTVFIDVTTEQASPVLIGRMKPLQIMRAETIQRQNPIIRPFIESRALPKVNIDQGLRLNTGAKPLVKLNQSQSQAQIQSQSLRQQQELKQELRQRNRQKIKQDLVRPEETTFLKGNEEAKQEKRIKLFKLSKSKGYAAFIKKKGKWIQVSKSTSKSSALDIMTSRLKTSLSATGRVMEVKESPTNIRTGGEFGRFARTFRSYQIRKGRKIPTPGQFIEKRGTRLSTRAEVKAIQSSKSYFKKSRRSKWL